MQVLTHKKCAETAWKTARNISTLAAHMDEQDAKVRTAIAARIRQLRAAKGNPPQDAVARDMDVGYRSYQAWEAGDTRPSHRNLRKIAAYYGTTTEFLLVGDPLTGTHAESQLDRIEQQLQSISDRLAGLHNARHDGQNGEVLKKIERTLDQLLKRDQHRLTPEDQLLIEKFAKSIDRLELADSVPARPPSARAPGSQAANRQSAS